MNIQARYPTTADEFLRWNEGREGKREFVRGKVVEMMVGVSKYHFIIVSRILHQLMTQLGVRDYAIGAAEFGVRTASGVRYPEILVDRMGGGNVLAATEPLLIGEVPSPSSYNADFGEKVADYSSIASLRGYFVFSQDEPRVWKWSRDNAGAWSGPSQVSGVQMAVELESPRLSLELSAIYEGILEGPQ
jgi:Uma2 family endonuclease